MKKQYTKKQIQEAINYWQKQLDMMNESTISDFFGKVFKTKDFQKKQAELKQLKDYEKHPLMKIANDMMSVDKNSSYRAGTIFYKALFTNADFKNDGYPIDVSKKLDCIAVRKFAADIHDREPMNDEDKKNIEKMFTNGGGDLNKYQVIIVDDNFAVICDKNLNTKDFKVTKINESENDFKKIDDIVTYLKDKKLKWIKVVKFQRLNAYQSKGGEEIETVGSDGNTETKRKTKSGDWVVNNVSNKDNKWIIDDKTFKKKYEEEKDGVYKPKGGPMLAAKVSDCEDAGVEFAPPNWGGDFIKIKNDGWFMKDPSNEKDIYAISKKDFDSTYKKA